MSKKLKELKEWAAENVTLVKLLPPNDNLEVTNRLIDVLEDEVDEKYYLSEEKTRKLTLDYDLGADIEPIINVLGNTSATGYKAHDIHDANGLSPTIAARDYKGPKQIAVPVLTPDRINKRQNGRRFKDDGEPMFTLTAQDRHGIAIREATKQGYAIAEQGDSVNVSFPDSKTRRGRVGKQLANTLQAGETNQGVVIDDTQGYDGVRTYKGISPTLRSSRSGLKTIDNLRIRKLTALECWRLQGFTDDQFYKAKNSGVSNSQLYKQSGNSVTVNVVDAIVKQLKE